jgi:hypothetical protein
MDAIHSSLPVGGIDSADVGLDNPHASWKPSVAISLPEDVATIRVDFDRRLGLVAEDEVGEEAASGASEEVEGTQTASPISRNDEGAEFIAGPLHPSQLSPSQHPASVRRFL